jgi:hypothetical protein
MRVHNFVVLIDENDTLSNKMHDKNTLQFTLKFNHKLPLYYLFYVDIIK